MSERSKAIAQAIANIEKSFGKGAIMDMGSRRREVLPSIPSGSPSLDLALGCGGYPKGRIGEIYGPESSGKTTLMLHAIAECQKAGGQAAFVDAEHALDVRYAAALGVEPKGLLVSQPDSAEQALEIVDTLVRSEAFDLIVIDSVAALVPQAEIEGEMGASHMGLQARLMSQALRKLTGIAHRAQTSLLFINQLRHKIGVTFGSPETTPGGNALKYFASLRLDVRRIGPVKVGEEVLGNRTRVKVVKNKLAPPFAIAEFDIRYGQGIDPLGDLLDLALQQGIIEKNGGYYRWKGETLAQGREKARQLLESNQELRQTLWQSLQSTSAALSPESQAAA